MGLIAAGCAVKRQTHPLPACAREPQLHGASEALAAGGAHRPRLCVVLGRRDQARQVRIARVRAAAGAAAKQLL